MTWKQSITLISSLFLLLTVSAASASARDVSPFEAVRWQGMNPQVRVDGTWYGVTSIDGVAVDEIMEHCASRHAGRERKRFGEDLVQLLREMGRTPGVSVDLVLVDLESGVSVVRDDVRMTKANRRRIWEANQKDRPPRANRGDRGRNRDENRGERRAGPALRRRVTREHAAGTPDAFTPIVKRYAYAQDEPVALLTPEQAAQDLDELEWALEDQYAYLERKGVDYRGVLDAIRANLGDGIPLADFTIQCAKLINMFGDGHARVRGLARVLPAGFLPFVVADTGNGLVAAAVTDGTPGLLDERHPYLSGLDGVAIDRWIEAAGRTVCAGSPSLVRRQSIERLSFLAFVRQDMGLPASDTVDVELSAPDGRSRRVVTLAVTERLHERPPAPGSSFDRLAGDVGYLRLAQMDRTAAAVADEAMRVFGDTEGLVIDVRGNGGGSRDALRVLFPHFLPRDARPVVVNTGVYRLSSKFPGDHLAARFMYRADAAAFDARDRASVHELAVRFEPEWRPAAAAFSAWHFFVMAPETNPASYHYTKPVAILLDGGCFSATDIFLGAFAGHDGVTLVGTTSSGGSGRSQSIELAHSGVRIRLSSMASFRPDGRLYDGRGIEVDVEVRPTLSDVLGRTDTALDAALEVVTR